MVSYPRYQPPDKEKLQRVYDERLPLFKQLKEEVEYILSRSIKDQGIEISRIESRIKDFPSFYDKIARKELSRGDVFEKIDDIAGVRVICLYRSDLQEVDKIIRKAFDVREAEVSHERASPFGYMSDHYVVSLPEHFRGERYDAIKRMRCEIQTRSVAMHAWATISHHLVYKRELDVPSDLRNDFTALSGVFFIADSLFEQFRNARRQSLSRLSKSVGKTGISRVLNEEINLDTLVQYLRLKLPDRRHSDLRAVSELVSDIRKAKIEDYIELDKIVSDNLSWLLKYEKRYLPAMIRGKGSKKGPKFVDVGVIRVILRHVRRLTPFVHSSRGINRKHMARSRAPSGHMKRT